MLQTVSHTEDKSFEGVDRQQFKGWLKKWQQAQIPLLSCLFIEILSPAKVLSLAFQDEEIDIVKSILRIKVAKQQLDRLERKNLEDLPTITRFLEKVEEDNGRFLYQNVALHAFQEAKDFTKKAKNVLLGKIKHVMETRLEVAENKVVIHAATVLNTEGWEQYDEDGEEDLSFADNVLEKLYNHFKDPLSQAGLLGSLLGSLSEEWNMVLLLVELPFSIPISNAKVERLFSLMKRVKTDSRASLNESAPLTT
jgi:hypothetical protein